jgi:hypothetical protein
MAQTDHQNLADALATAGANFTAAGVQITTAGTGVTTTSQECARIPNVQAIHNNQPLIDLINQNHNQVTQRINTLQTDIITLRTDMTNRLDAR